ncbi:hypothetical protein KGE51_09730 [Lactobacillus amylovorus]|nr:hypothetical protein [Lactobacillus amylovorus]UIK34909.1 hypothetical protein KGE51_09730 [Lactobacillus amylovorus]
MMYLAHGSVDGAIQAAQIAAVASLIGAIVSIIIAIYNNRMRLKAEEKMYVAKMYIEKSGELYEALNNLSNQISEINNIIDGMANCTCTARDLLSNKAYKSFQNSYVPEMLEIEEIGSYYPELKSSIDNLKDSVKAYRSKLPNVPNETKSPIKVFIETEKLRVEKDLSTLKNELQEIVTKKVEMMNDDNKSVVDRFVEWLGK